jgi:hypothetical protein
MDGQIGVLMRFQITKHSVGWIEEEVEVPPLTIGKPLSRSESLAPNCPGNGAASTGRKTLIRAATQGGGMSRTLQCRCLQSTGRKSTTP